MGSTAPGCASGSTHGRRRGAACSGSGSGSSSSGSGSRTVLLAYSTRCHTARYRYCTVLYGRGLLQVLCALSVSQRAGDYMGRRWVVLAVVLAVLVVVLVVLGPGRMLVLVLVP